MASRASVTWGPRARDLFVNREEFIREFTRRLNEEPPADSILCVTGEGGIGKSLLIDILNDRYCRRLVPRDRDSALRLDNPWARVAGLKGPHFVRALLEAESEPVPTAYIDFASAGAELDRPLEAFSALQSIRRQLLQSGREPLRTPVFQYGAIQYLLRTRQLDERWCAKLFPAAEADLAAAILDQFNAGGWLVGVGATLFTGATLSMSLAAGAILKGLWGVAAEQVKEQATVWRAARNAPEEDIREIDRLKDGELLEYLPELLARDLNASMALPDAPKRIALLFDSHERFWGSDRTRLSPFDLAARDSWLRNFISSLDLTGGVVVIIGGQESPRWSEAGLKAPPMLIRRVDYLEVRPAEEYLTRADVPHPEQAKLLHEAQVEHGVQPFYLGLLVDAYRLETSRPPISVARKRGGDPFRQVVTRLEAAVGPDLRAAIRAISTCLSFDQPLFQVLGTKLGFATTRDQFDVLVSLSFVRPAGEGQYRIHNLVRRFYRDDHEVNIAHTVLRDHYESRASESGTATARFVYHCNQLDSSAGLHAWHARFEEAFTLSRSEVCESLLQLRPELLTHGPIDEGRLSYAAARFFMRYSRYATAEAEFRAAIRSFAQADDEDFLSVWCGLAVTGLADLEAQLSRHEAALESYGQAIEEFDQALHRAPDYVGARNNKGLALESRAALEAQLSRHEAALESYGQAIEEFDQALHRAPDYVGARNNKGTALQGRAALEAQLSRHEAALESYGQAIEEFDQALRRAPDDVGARNNRGIALQRRADLEAQLSRHEAALESYGQAIEEFDQALRRAPDDVGARNNKGNALKSRADLEAQLSRHEAALESYGQAIEEFDQALRRAPDDVGARNNRGIALQRRADLEAELSRHEAALESYGQAIEEFDQALHRAPDDVDVRNNKGAALQSRAALEAELSRHEAALESYGQAIAEYDQALRLAPDDVLARNNKGNALKSRADLEAQLSRHEAALESYGQAIEEFDQALRVAPNGGSFHGRCSARIKLAIVASRPELLHFALTDLADWEALQDGSEQVITSLRTVVMSLQHSVSPS